VYICKKIEKNVLIQVVVIDVIEKIITYDCNVAIISVPIRSTHMRTQLCNYTNYDLCLTIISH